MILQYMRRACPYPSDGTARRKGTGARLRMAWRGALRPFHSLDDIPQREFVRSLGKAHASADPAHGTHDSLFHQATDDAPDKGQGQLPLLRHRHDGHPLSRLLTRQVQHDARRVIGLATDGKH